jgi:c-di-GMP-binding flagellar brake protein YcgR
MENHKGPGIERRKHSRVPVDLNVAYRVKSPAQVKIKIAGAEKDATVVNISEGGMAFIADHELPEMTKLDIRFHIQLRGGRESVISCVGQVCYSFLLADYQRYHTGIEFIMIHDKEKRLIADLVRSTLKKESRE